MSGSGFTGLWLGLVAFDLGFRDSIYCRLQGFGLRVLGIESADIADWAVVTLVFGFEGAGGALVGSGLRMGLEDRGLTSSRQAAKSPSTLSRCARMGCRSMAQALSSFGVLFRRLCSRNLSTAPLRSTTPV